MHVVVGQREVGYVVGDRQTDRQTDRDTDRQTDRQTDGRTDGRMEGRKDRQTEKETQTEVIRDELSGFISDTSVKIVELLSGSLRQLHSTVIIHISKILLV